MDTKQKYTPEHDHDCPLNENLWVLPILARDEHWYVLNTRINLVFKHLIPLEGYLQAHPEDVKTKFYHDTLLFILGALQKGVRKHERYLMYAPHKEQIAGGCG